MCLYRGINYGNTLNCSSLEDSFLVETELNYTLNSSNSNCFGANITKQESFDVPCENYFNYSEYIENNLINQTMDCWYTSNDCMLSLSMQSQSQPCNEDKGLRILLSVVLVLFVLGVCAMNFGAIFEYYQPPTNGRICNAGFWFYS